MQITLVDLFEVNPQNYTPDTEQEIADLLIRATAECQKRQEFLARASAYEQELATRSQELGRIAAQVQAQKEDMLLQAVEELTATTIDCDSRGLSQRLRTVEDQRLLCQDALDLLQFIHLPAAFLEKLEAVHKLRRAEALRASLEVSRSKMGTLGKLIAAGVFLDGNRIGLISAESEMLTALARNCEAQAERAEDEIRQARKRQEALTQQRMATGQVTRIEIIFHAIASRSKQ